MVPQSPLPDIWDTLDYSLYHMCPATQEPRLNFHLRSCPPHNIALAAVTQQNWGRQPSNGGSCLPACFSCPNIPWMNFGPCLIISSYSTLLYYYLYWVNSSTCATRLWASWMGHLMQCPVHCKCSVRDGPHILVSRVNTVPFVSPSPCPPLWLLHPHPSPLVSSLKSHHFFPIPILPACFTPLCFLLGLT